MNVFDLLETLDKLYFNLSNLGISKTLYQELLGNKSSRNVSATVRNSPDYSTQSHLDGSSTGDSSLTSGSNDQNVTDPFAVQLAVSKFICISKNEGTR